jgi:hypothetical protein
MIKIKRSQLADLRFVRAIQKLASMPMNTSTAFSIKKIIDILDAARSEMKADYRSEVLEKFSVKDEDGQLVYEDAEKTEFKVLEGKDAELKKAQEEFGEKELELPGVKVNLANLNVQLSAAELSQLEPIYFHVESAPAEMSSVKN